MSGVPTAAEALRCRGRSRDSVSAVAHPLRYTSLFRDPGDRTDTPVVFSSAAADLLLFYVGDRGGGVEATVGMCGRAASAVASAGRERAAPPPVNTRLFPDPGLFRDRRLIQHRVTLKAVHCRQREYTPPCCVVSARRVGGS